MADYKMVRAEESHTAYLAAHMREQDKLEVWAASHRTPEEALTRSLAVSPLAYSVINEEGNCFAMFGVGAVNLLSEKGSPWLLGSDELVTRFRKDIVSVSRHVVEEFRRMYPILENYVFAENCISKLWLTRLGFTLLPAEPYGIEGKLFNKFYMRSK